MPFYTYRCDHCGHQDERFLHVEQRDTHAPACCEATMTRTLHAPLVHVPANLHYICPVTGEGVTNERQRRNIMAREGLVDANDFTPEYIVRRQKKKTEARQKLAAQLPGLPEGVTREQIFSDQ